MEAEQYSLNARSTSASVGHMAAKSTEAKKSRISVAPQDGQENESAVPAANFH